MNDMTSVIIPKSDQINADDLIAGPITVTIRDVQIKGGQEQPVSIAMEGQDKVYRPCKSMSRVLVAMWGPDAKQYVGRSMTLYRDPAVKWGGMAVGGIRISHMSHIPEAKTMALTETRAQRKPFTVKPLTEAPANNGIDAARRAIAAAPTLDALKIVRSSKAMAPFRDALQQDLDDRKAALSFEPEGRATEDTGEGFTDNGRDALFEAQ